MARTANCGENTSTPPPSRVVSLSLASDEITAEIMQRCGAQHRLIAVSTFANNAEYSQGHDVFKTVPHRVHSEPESIAALKPDLVLASTFNRGEILLFLKSRRIPTHILDGFRNSGDISRHILEIGERVGCIGPAKILASEFNLKLDKIRKLSEQKKRLAIVPFDETFVLMGGDTLFSDLMAMNGFDNIVASKGLKNWPKINEEVLTTWKPDAVVFQCQTPPCTAMHEAAMKSNVWKKLAAVKNQCFVDMRSIDANTTSHHFGNEIIRPNSKCFQ